MEMSYERFQKVQGLYWVLTPCYSNSDVGIFDWVFSPNLEPYPVMNQSMPWRRPTYEECIQRQMAYEEDSKEFIKRAIERSKELHLYVYLAEQDARRKVAI